MSAKEELLQRQKNAQVLLFQSLRRCMNTPRKFLGFSDAEVPSNFFSYKGPPEELVSTLTNPTDVSGFIYAPVDLLGSLTPKIEFWLSSAEKRDSQFHFPDHTKAEKTIELSRARMQGGGTSAKEVLKSRGTGGTDVGVKEFRWTWDNKHDGDKTIKASLSLYFGSILELLNEEYLQFIFLDKGLDVETIGEKKGSTKKDEETVWAKDLIDRYKKSSQSASESTGLNKTPIKDYQQLKVVVGWSVPTQINSPRRNVKLTSFVNGVKNSQKVIALNLIAYKLNFQQEGQVVLEIDYVGSLDQVYSDNEVASIFSYPGTDPRTVQRPLQPNLETNAGFFYWATGTTLFTTPFTSVAFGASEPKLAKQKVKGYLYTRFKYNKDNNKVSEPIQVSLAQLEYERDTLKSHLKWLNKFRPDDPDQKKPVDDGLTAVNSAIKQFEGETRNAQYSKFTERIFNSDRLYYLPVAISSLQAGTAPAPATPPKNPVTQAEIDKLTNWRNTAHARATATRSSRLAPMPADIKEIETRLAKQKAAARRSTKASSENPAGQGQPNPAAERAKKAVELAAKRQAEDGAATTEEMNALDPEKFGKDIPGIRRLYFIRLGDLIGSALMGIQATPIMGFSKKQGAVNAGADVILGSFVPAQWNIPGFGDKDNAQLANLPISIEYFSNWFIENITSKNISKMSYRSFVDRLLNKLVAPLINQVLLPGEDSVKVSFELTTVLERYRIREPKDDKDKGTIDEKDLDRTFKKEGLINGSAYNSHYFIVSTSQVHPRRTGDFKKDKQDNIIHLVLGAGNGLVKTFSFSEKKMPFLRAMHVENNSRGSALVLPQDVELTMVGNSLFRNGNIVYIDASFALGSKVAQTLGIGGYYKVVRSDNVINSGKFETRLTCMFERATKQKPKSTPGVK